MRITHHTRVQFTENMDTKPLSASSQITVILNGGGGVRFYLTLVWHTITCFCFFSSVRSACHSYCNLQTPPFIPFVSQHSKAAMPSQFTDLLFV
ncbi:hypothetical protein VNO77_12777 [Canavalia gladiata]|uniref:Uncharacterized protein n=1 Tax=Canavalia gladiata TaxID=3824 RepID=A0AAN9QR91_CANGL